jgi:hypothetical protein
MFLKVIDNGNIQVIEFLFFNKKCASLTTFTDTKNIQSLI